MQHLNEVTSDYYSAFLTVTRQISKALLSDERWLVHRRQRCATQGSRWRYNQLQKYLRHCTVFWYKWPVHHLVLVIPLHPLSKLTKQDHAQNMEGQLWMGGRREVSIISQRPLNGSDLKHERVFFRESVSTFLQLVVATLKVTSFPTLQGLQRDYTCAKGL